MKYPCLVLDHDDTVVNSTATIHYPSFVAFLKEKRPGASYSLDDYFRWNFEPGVLEFFRDIVGLSEQELKEEFEFWQEYVKTRVPQAYPGMRELLERHRAAGGTIAVVSHSLSANIRRDYRQNGLPEPDFIYGWDFPPEQRKPNPFPLEQLMGELGLRPEQLLMVDDLKPGYDMCRACNVPFAAAGWANDVPEIRRFMQKNCDFYFKTVAELDALLQEPNHI